MYRRDEPWRRLSSRLYEEPLAHEAVPRNTGVLATAAHPKIQIVGEPGDARPAPKLPSNALEELVDVARVLQAEEIDLDHLLHVIATKARELLRTDTSWIALLDESRARVRIAATCGTVDPDFPRMEVDLGTGLGGVALDRGWTLIVADYLRYQQSTPPFVRQVMLREGIASVICAPMMRGQNMVGALYVGNRLATRFDGTHGSLMATLAAQASAAIENGRLYERLLDKTRLLEATFEIHRQLGEVAMAELGLEGVMTELARLTGRRLRLEQAHVAPFELHVGPEGAGQVDEPIALVVPVVTRGADAGSITVYGARPLTELEHNAFTHGATVLALELMKHEAALAVEWRLRGELLEELLSMAGEPSETLLVRANRLGFDLNEPHRLLVIELGKGDRRDLDSLARHLRSRRYSDVRLAGRFGERVVVVTSDSIDGARRLAIMLRGEAAAPTAVVIGISSSGCDFSATFREARACAAFALANGATPVAAEYDALGALRFMLDASDPAHCRAIVRERLGTLHDYDARHGTQLLPTLRAYLETNGKHASIAARCHVHPSTVKYRIGRIAQLLEHPIDGAETRFELTLALRLLDLFRATGADLLAPA